MNVENVSKFKLSTFWFMIKSIFKASPILFIFVVSQSIAQISIGAFLLYVIKDATNALVGLIDGTNGVELVFQLVFLYLIIELLVRVIMNWIFSLSTDVYFKNVEQYFRTLLLYKLGKLPQEKMYDNKVYDKYQFTYWNIFMFYDMPWMLIRFLINFGFSKLLYLAIVFSFNFYIGLYCTVLLIGNMLLGIFISNRVGETHKKQTVPIRNQKYFTELMTTKRYIKETKIYILESYFFKRFEKWYLKVRDAYYKVWLLQTLINQGILFANFFFKYGLTALLLYMVYKGELDVGEAALIRIAGESLINVSWQFKRPVEEIVKFVSYAPTMIDMIFPITKEEHKEIKKLEYEDFALKLGDFKSIEVNNVSYGYPSREDDQVSDFNLTINKGDIVSVLGYNGSGKTTATKLIAGVLEPTSGNILFNGTDIKEYDIKEYYKYFGIGFQDFCKYRLTMKENIAFGRIEEIENEELIAESIKKANLKNIIDRLPDGIDTVMGKELHKKGQDLSGGEWQKVILSRAYMGSPEILVLDEPTASIDPFEEERMLEEFKNILKDKTAILISHRISFARLANKIVMMKDGKIVEQGNHDELLLKKGYYYKLFTSQQDLYMDGDDFNE